MLFSVCKDIFFKIHNQHLFYKKNDIVNKIVEYEKAVLKNPKSDIIEQLIEYKEIYKEMEENNHNLAFIRWFTNDIINGYSDFSKVLCNIT